jgi:type I restriction enzyme S subunit
MSEWKTVRLGDISHIEMGQAPPSRYVSDREADGSLPFLQGNGEFGDINPIPKLWCTKPAKMAQAGDTLISVRAPVGEMNIADQDYVIGRGLAAIRFRGVDARYGAHQVMLRRHQLNRVAQGSTFDAVSSNDIKSLEIPIPDRADQSRIAEVLDCVDEKIRSKRLTVDKIVAIEDGLVHDLITCGINANGALRNQVAQREQFQATPFGLVPADWTISTVGDTFEIKSGITLGPLRVPKRNSSAYLRVANVRRGALDLADVSRLQATLLERADYALRDGDLLVVEGHADVGQIGRCARVINPPQGLLYQNHLFRLRSEVVDPVFAETWLNSAYARSYWRATCSTSSGLNTINSGQLKAMAMAIPAPREQRRLRERIESIQMRRRTEVESLDCLIAMKEGLASDLLSGRVRVSKETRNE